MPNFSTKSLIASGSSSSTTRPRIWSRSLYLSCSSTRSGISARQGPHQVAQKFKRMTLPLESASVTGLPSRPVSLNSGAGSGLRTKRTVGCWSCAAVNEGNKQSSCAAMKKRIKPDWRVRLMVSCIGKHSGGTTPRGRLKFLGINLPTIRAERRKFVRGCGPAAKVDCRSLRIVDLQRQHNFFKLAHDFDFVRVLDSRIEIRIGAGDDFQKEFVARSVRIAGVIAVEKSSASRSRASLPPIKGGSLNGCCAEGVRLIERNGKGLTGFARDSRVDNKLESAADESSIGIRVWRNRDSRDECSAGLLCCEFLSRFENRGVF